MDKCEGTHRYFVATSCGVEKEGVVVVVALCTGCGHVVNTKVQVSSGGKPLLLTSDEKNKQ